MTDALVDRGDVRVVRSVAKNAGARFSDQGFGKLVGRVAGDETLAEASGSATTCRATISSGFCRPHRARCENSPPRPAHGFGRECRRYQLGEQESVRRCALPHPRSGGRATKRRFITRQLKETDMHEAGIGEKFEKAVAALALLGQRAGRLVERALLDKSPDIVLILAKAANCSRATTERRCS